MNVNHTISLLQTDYTTVDVGFLSDRAQPQGTIPSTRKYTYKVLLSAGISVGDIVVVDRSNDLELPSLSMAKVEAIHTAPRINTDASFDYKWIVQKVDRSAYVKQLKAEAEFRESLQEVQRMEQRDRIIKALKATIPDSVEAAEVLEKAIANLNGATVPALK